MILITATGRDRPGMVAAISKQLFAANCNIEDTTMTRLSGEFAMILVVAPPDGVGSAELAKQLSSLRESHGLQIHCDEIEDDHAASTPTGEHGRFMLSVYGPDRNGLVAQVAEVLADFDVNITDLQTRVTGQHELYVMLFEIEPPANLELARLNQHLDEAAGKLGLEYSMHPIEEDAL